ncbi:MAG: AraC family transcriptional regulator [Spongiibacteraceae bacterium]
MQEISISSYFLRAVLGQAQTAGLVIPDLLRRASIPIKLLAEEGARVTAEQYATLQTITMREMDDEMLGYGRLPLKVGTWSALCHWLIHSRTLSQALKRFCLFYSLMQRGLKSDLSTNAGQLSIRFSPWHDDEQLQPYAMELFIFGFHRLACWLINDNLLVLSARFPYPKPDHYADYLVMFPGGPSLFAQPSCELIFDRKIMEIPIQQTPETLSKFLRQPLLNMLINDYNQKTWAAKTRAVLREELINSPNITDVALKLSVHPRKLRRELGKEGISYGDLKNQLRRDIAIRYLTKTSKPVEKIAYLLGFSEACTFTRAFRQWTGVTPCSYRKQLN